jgi:asparagine synthase (glutamine-hydrolysing)
VERGKRGFEAPIGEWLQKPLAPLVSAVLLDGRLASRGLFSTREVERLWHEHHTGRADHRHRVWQLLMLELWFREFIDRAPASERQLDTTARRPVSHTLPIAEAV